MPTSLFCLDVLGKMYHLPTTSSQWEQLPYLGVEFKKISASQNSIWAIGSDQQVYVYVYGLENPIRVKVDTYENQRWNPIDGFCSKLLATDRPHYSSKDGTECREFNGICLPSLGWQWEGPWVVDGTLDGTPLETEGWTYAVDFPATFSAQKRFTSCVRRRHWVRYRRYVAVSSWSSVPPLHRDAVEEPFVDVAVGGAELPGWEADNLMVWAVTIRGRIIYRSNVSWLSPEGDGWVHVPSAQGGEARQIACGPSGLTWAVTWEGAALVRTGMCRDTPHGTEWCPVLPPPGVQLEQVSVGDDCVWAVSRDKRVFFRKGVKGREMCENTTLARGTGWLEMVGSMASVSVGLSNQVLTLGTDGGLYLRSHVTSGGGDAASLRLLRLDEDEPRPQELWRQTVREQLRKRNEQLQPFRVYDEAVER
ncbi:tectonin beta-propeller repeat-containing protein-like [Pollicipes pollicipes]|uniref:tectonin beta-propeller repeat-containing protein-like n=1 Tax=Pollicipes pollicipes TaxID=41117 RepID=UPI0018859926|nr:tectonin beta-propeller repeat-containing protein-like [Pollicipes pollicipes]